MTTADFISELFYRVDEAMKNIPKHPLASLWPSETVTLGILFALKGVGNRAFSRWLRRDCPCGLEGCTNVVDIPKFHIHAELKPVKEHPKNFLVPLSEFAKWCGARALFRHFVTLSATKIVTLQGKIASHRE